MCRCLSPAVLWNPFICVYCDYMLALRFARFAMLVPTFDSAVVITPNLIGDPAVP